MYRKILTTIPLIFCCVACRGLAVAQIPERTQDVVRQALELADRAGPPRDAGGQSVTSGIPNPFAKGISVPSAAAPSAAAPNPQVEIQQDAIRIQVAGKDIVVPMDRAARAGQAPAAVTIDGQPIAHAEDSLATAMAWQTFAEGITSFRAGDYTEAMRQFEQCLTEDPGNTMVPPFLSLSLLAGGQYERAAEFAYATAATQSPWDWDQLRSLYGRPADYAEQYEQLQHAARQSDSSTSVHFLLAWQHLMLGHRAAAAAELKEVAARLPADPVVDRLLWQASQAEVPPPQPLK